MPCHSFLHLFLWLSPRPFHLLAALKQQLLVALQEVVVLSREGPEPLDAHQQQVVVRVLGFGLLEQGLRADTQQFKLILDMHCPPPLHLGSWTHLQQQQVFGDPLDRLQEQIVEGGFGFVARNVELVSAACGRWCHPIRM